ncbi:MAG: hypothetical protein IJT99_01145 [Clostridia bacterium]|nr:hypothetical protein [Clostridia bacterium]
MMLHRHYEKQTAEAKSDNSMQVKEGHDIPVNAEQKEKPKHNRRHRTGK